MKMMMYMRSRKKIKEPKCQYKRAGIQIKEEIFERRKTKKTWKIPLKCHGIMNLIE